MANPWQVATRLLAGLFLVFLAHRGLTFTGLDQPPTATPAAALLTGSLSDLWIAALLATLYLLTRLLLLPLRLLPGRIGSGQTAARGAAWFWFAVPVLLTALHQSYVDYFGFQVIPFHLLYFADPDFIGANFSSGAGPAALLTLGAALPGGYLLHRALTGTGRRRDPLVFAALWCACLLAHSANIHYRVQWFVPQKLRVHYMEHLWHQLRLGSLPAPLHPGEESLLAGQARAATLLHASGAFPGGPHPAAPLLRREVQRQRRAGKVPVLAVLLLESARPAESALYREGAAAGDRPGLTPVFDRLARRGLHFTNARAPGTVTRGGQEAVFCGYPGNTHISVMRGRADLELLCLPAITGSPFFWYHGGHGAFDAQRAFWQNHGIRHLLSWQDFPPDSPATDWGVSDLTLFRTATEQIAGLRREYLQKDDEALLYGMVLTVTNHIPWRVPADLQLSLPPGADAGHPSWSTTAYTDQALGRWVTMLRDAGIWDSLLLVIASDHGVRVPAWFNGPRSSDPAATAAIHLAISGGLTEKALAGAAFSRAIHRPVSQQDVAPLLAWLGGKDEACFFGENLLARDRLGPVLHHDGNRLWHPPSGRSWPAASGIKGLPHPQPADFPLIWYRKLLHRLNQAGRTPLNSWKKEDSPAGSRCPPADLARGN